MSISREQAEQIALDWHHTREGRGMRLLCEASKIRPAGVYIASRQNDINGCWFVSVALDSLPSRVGGSYSVVCVSEQTGAVKAVGSGCEE